MKSLKYASLALLIAGLVSGAVACSEFEPIKAKGNKVAATTNGNGQAAQQEPLVTKFAVTAKNSNGALDTIQITVVKGGKVFQVYNGEIDIDATATGQTASTFANATIGMFNDAILYRSVLPSGDTTIVVKIFTEYADMSGDGAPEALVFAGRVGDANIRLLRDESFLKGLGLEQKTGFTTNQIINDLVTHMQTFGINGLDAFAATYGDNDASGGVLPAPETNTTGGNQAPASNNIPTGF